jgi:hypothetical protein
MGRTSLKIFSAFLAAAFLIGCATLFKGTNEEISINVNLKDFSHLCGK